MCSVVFVVFYRIVFGQVLCEQIANKAISIIIPALIRVSRMQFVMDEIKCPSYIPSCIRDLDGERPVKVVPIRKKMLSNNDHE